jgi:tetratricopeptide (TPR) repeat protein
MIVDGRRDHFFRIPRPDLTTRFGTPNACNGCHADRSAAWAARTVDAWYGTHPRDTAFVAAIAAGRAGARDAAPLLAGVAADTARAAIARATALDLLRAYPEAAGAVLAGATRDPDPLVRAAAAAAMETQPAPPRVGLATPLLDDPVRAVRVAAARVLAAVPRTLLTPQRQKRLDAALAEDERGLEAVADMPSSHLDLAVLDEARGRDDRAEAAYRRALAMDPYFLPARANLATLYNRRGRNADAERELREGIRRMPEEGELHYSLGLLLAEEQRFDEAASSLTRAAERIPGRARVRYNLGLTLIKLGRRGEAERALLEARRLDPGRSRHPRRPARVPPRSVVRCATPVSRGQKARGSLAFLETR